MPSENVHAARHEDIRKHEPVYLPQIRDTPMVRSPVHWIFSHDSA
jgi:hypothetical protein